PPAAPGNAESNCTWRACRRRSAHAQAAVTAPTSASSSMTPSPAPACSSTSPLEPHRPALEPDVIRGPLQHDVVLADLQDRKALLDPDDLAPRLLAEAAVQQIHLLGDPLLALNVGRVRAADDDSLHEADFAEIELCRHRDLTESC